MSEREDIESGRYELPLIHEDARPASRMLGFCGIIAAVGVLAWLISLSACAPAHAQDGVGGIEVVVDLVISPECAVRVETTADRVPELLRIARVAGIETVVIFTFPSTLYSAMPMPPLELDEIADANNIRALRAAQTRALASALRDEFETPDPETEA